MNQHQFKKWQLKEGSTIYNARTQLLSTTDVLSHIIRDRDLAVFILDRLDFDQLKNISIPEISSMLKSGYFLPNNEKINLVAEQIIAAIELGRRTNTINSTNNKDDLSTSEIASRFFREKFTDINSCEELIVAFLNCKLQLIAWEIVFRGTIRATTVSQREILIKSLKNKSECILIAHNHPGSSREPTSEDLGVTKVIKQGCKAIDIRLLDHLVITEEDFYSIKDEAEGYI